MTAPVASSTSTLPLPGAPRGPVLGKEDFLAMLVAQLRNQDPLSPVDGAAYAAQLAQFSAVEQLISVNKALDGQAVSLAENALIGQTQLGASLVGREVVLRGNALASDGSTPGRVMLDLPQGAARVTIEVYDGSGKRVGVQDFGPLASGRADLTLDGVTLPKGLYTYKTTTTGVGKVTPPVQTFAIGQVEAVSFLDGKVVLRINGASVPLLDIVEILSAAKPASLPSTEESSQP